MSKSEKREGIEIGIVKHGRKEREKRKGHLRDIERKQWAGIVTEEMK